MNRATVKSISVKEGDNAKGHWINTQITTTENAKLGTFEHRCANLKAGDEFEFEPEMNGNKVNIKAGTFKLVKQGTQLSETKTTARNIESPEPPSDIDLRPQDYPANLRDPRVSIEGQVALKELGESIRADKQMPVGFFDLYFRIIQQKLKDWTGLEPLKSKDTTQEGKMPPATPQPQKNEGVEKVVVPKITGDTVAAIKAWYDRDNGAYSKGIYNYVLAQFKKKKVSELTEAEAQYLLKDLKDGKIKKAVKDAQAES